LRDAELFTARAYSVLEFESKIDSYGGSYTNSFRPLALGHGSLHRALTVPRVFDKDHAASVRVLNERISALQGIGLQPEMKREQLIREEDSRAIDALQAADIAAGFARDLRDRKGLRALAAQFRRVLLNGIDLHRLKGFN
jgi:hypothetical protein